VAQSAMVSDHPIDSIDRFYRLFDPRSKPLTLRGSRLARTNQRRARSDRASRQPAENDRHQRLTLLDRAFRQELTDSEMGEEDPRGPAEDTLVVGYRNAAQRFVRRRRREDEEEILQEIVSVGQAAGANLVRLTGSPEYLRTLVEGLESDPEIGDHGIAITLGEFDRALALQAVA
jgi:hypothetical protein